MNTIKYLFLTLCCCIASTSYGQVQKSWSSSEIHAKIKKLNVLGSVLYFAAHPDDENTRLISYLANHRYAETAYLSLTRGGGGQNRIGTEIREELGVLRTEELMAARRIDGGIQFFTRANDFGFSKHPDETFRIWNKEEVMRDIIQIIRQYQPDIIINRFDHRTPGTTHGHHTGASILAMEAFETSGKTNVFPEQLQDFQAFQSERIFFNTSWWFYGSQEKFEAADKTNLYSEDVGVYLPLMGKSCTEVAAESRSQHKCQGFGAGGKRGSHEEFMEYLAGSRPTDKHDIFSGINTTWSRLTGGAHIEKMVDQLDKSYNAMRPGQSVPQLIKIRKAILALDDSVWKSRKLKEVELLLQACSGIYISATTNSSFSTPGASEKIELEITNRSQSPWLLKGIQDNLNQIDTSLNQVLKHNTPAKFAFNIQIPNNQGHSSAYWLEKPGTLGLYEVEGRKNIGKPNSPEPLLMELTLQLDGQQILYPIPVEFSQVDPVAGDIREPFEILAPAFAEIKADNLIFKPNEIKTIRVQLLANRDDIAGKLVPKVAKGWTINPVSSPFKLEKKQEEKFIEFQVQAPHTTDQSNISIELHIDEQVFHKKLLTIAYDHIKTQRLERDNTTPMNCIDIQTNPGNIGYFMGAGDKVPDALKNIGYKVDILKESDIQAEKLKEYRCIIVGIRAYNVFERMPFHHKALMEYVHQGGLVIVQYNTRHRLKSKAIGPYPITLSRKRITDEHAAVRILDKNHPILHYPNTITAQDFDNWVQERGLYFPSEWDKRYETIISSNDAGEEALDGGLLSCSYGKGHYIYTGYSFFRELPAGVPGAYRLFANMIEYGQQIKP